MNCRSDDFEKARLFLTMGDVAGIGPEIIVKAWPELLDYCQPLVVGDPFWLKKALSIAPHSMAVQETPDPEFLDTGSETIPCINASREDLTKVITGQVSGQAGRAAFDYLCAAIDWTLEGKGDGIVTLPLHKEGLKAAGLNYPGHTEILAHRTGAKHFAMLLSAKGITVAHVTLHMALKDVFEHLTPSAILEKIDLVRGVVSQLQAGKPRIGVAALNPHASDGGLFGDEEERIIRPAVEAAKKAGWNVSGPLPSDTLFVRASHGEFDGIVAMYHDQGHIALKLLGGLRAVNITAGLPIVRTSVAHGTAYDIAGQGMADPISLIEAVKIAALLCQARKSSRGIAHAAAPKLVIN